MYIDKRMAHQQEDAHQCVSTLYATRKMKWRRREVKIRTHCSYIVREDTIWDEVLSSSKLNRHIRKYVLHHAATLLLLLKSMLVAYLNM